jgi:hypothetical protein
MWQGEDRTFCLLAERNHIAMAADGWPDIWHCYRPSDANDSAVVSKRFRSEHERHKRNPRFGDFISARINPLEERTLGAHSELVRGRLGATRLLPEIEQALLQMKPRESRIVEATFPESLPSKKMLTGKGYIDIATAVRGQTRRFYVTLLDHRPYKLHPTEDPEWTQSTDSSQK